MIACAKWLGREPNSCTRLPGGCSCGGMRPEIAALFAGRQPLPEGTEIYSKWGYWEPLSAESLRNANKSPHHMHDTDPFWIHGWRDLVGSLRVPNDQFKGRE